MHSHHHLTLEEIPAELDGIRLDKALSLLVQGMDDAQALGLSRARVQALIGQGAISTQTGVVSNVRAKVRTGEVYHITVPEPVSATPQPQAIALDVVFEDDHLIVVNKPVGMVVHPAPGALDGTLVNALLHHCRDSLSGIGGEKRPGIVHRIDKDTSGLLVVAKSDAVHQGLSAQFANHSVQRQYVAFVWRAPDRANARLAGIKGLHKEDAHWWRLETHLERSRTDRTRIAVTKTAGRHAVTRFRVEDTYGDGIASKLICRLETGRTHQIRVHLSHLGFPLIGDQTYGKQVKPPKSVQAQDVQTLPRQALHAQTLGFVHPITGDDQYFESSLPNDLQAIETIMKTWE